MPLWSSVPEEIVRQVSQEEYYEVNRTQTYYLLLQGLTHHACVAEDALPDGVVGDGVFSGLLREFQAHHSRHHGLSWSQAHRMLFILWRENI